MRSLFYFSIFCLLYSCSTENIDDKSKRNEKWAWWVDSKTGKGTWVPLTNEESNLKNGKYTLFYSNGNKYEVGKLKDGNNVDTSYFFDLKENLIKYKIFVNDTIIHHYLNDGFYTAYYQDGKIFEKGIVSNHKRGRDWTRYFENGNIDWIEKLDGNTGLTIWYHENGQIRDSTFHVNGKPHGRIKHWYDNGNIQEISDWNEGIQNGLYELYFKNGQIEERTTWSNGKRIGKSEKWYENGNKRFIHYLKVGLLDGNAIEWHSNGNIRMKRKFLNGKKIGDYEEFHENGKLKCRGQFFNDEQHGEWYWYDSSGKYFQKDLYVMGTLTKIEKK